MKTKVFLAVVALSYAPLGVAGNKAAYPKEKVAAFVVEKRPFYATEDGKGVVVKELFGAPSSPLAGPLLSHAWLFPAMAAFAVLVELGAPVALLGGRWRDGWVAAAWLFHLGILVLMTTFSTRDPRESTCVLRSPEKTAARQRRKV